MRNFLKDKKIEENYPNKRVFERVHQRPMNFVDKAFDCIDVFSQNNRFCVVGKLALSEIDNHLYKGRNNLVLLVIFYFI